MPVAVNCPGCGADLTVPGSVEAAELHALRGFVRFGPDAVDFTDLQIFDTDGFADIDFDEVQQESHACRTCGTRLSASMLEEE